MPDDVSEIFDPAEDCPWRTPREILARQGYAPLAPSGLNDRQLPGRLWELLYAAAARRFFFIATNHLSDRKFYTLLWQQWLDKPTADIPPAAETNTTLIVSEFNVNGMPHGEIWLRFYAGEEDRMALIPGEILPPHEDPPFDRDRFLPTPPVPLDAHSGGRPGDEDQPDENSGDEPDPLGLAEIDRAIAADKKEFPPTDPLDSQPEAQLPTAEPENWTSPAQQLVRKNLPLLPPAEITDETLTPILWELLHHLAWCGFYILHTDHLSDRELYAGLWQRGLRDPAYLPGRNPRSGWFHDFLDSGDDAEMQLWLRYYASDEERARHVEDWPADPLPPREKPPFHRDWRLPHGPF
jgi:hypothetical protein